MQIIEFGQVTLNLFTAMEDFDPAVVSSKKVSSLTIF